jgi:hypothetical protein
MLYLTKRAEDTMAFFLMLWMLLTAVAVNM